MHSGSPVRSPAAALNCYDRCSSLRSVRSAATTPETGQNLGRHYPAPSGARTRQASIVRLQVRKRRTSDRHHRITLLRCAIPNHNQSTPRKRLAAGIRDQRAIASVHISRCKESAPLVSFLCRVRISFSSRLTASGGNGSASSFLGSTLSAPDP